MDAWSVWRKPDFGGGVSPTYQASHLLPRGRCAEEGRWFLRIKPPHFGYFN